MEDEQTHKHIRRLHLYILVLTVGVLVLLGFVFSDQLALITQREQATTENEQAESPTMVNKEDKGALTLQTKDNLRKYSVGKSFVVQVVGDSAKEDMVGFDVLLGYDKKVFTVSSVTTPLTGFKAIPNSEGEHLSVTASQDPTNSTRTMLKDTVILEITLVANQPGTYNLSLLPNAGAETTKFVTAQTNILYPKVQNLEVSVE